MMTGKHAKSCAARRPAGFTLAEILLAIAILAIGMVMVAAVFPTAISQAKETHNDTLATLISENAMSYCQSTFQPNSFLAGPVLTPITLNDGDQSYPMTRPWPVSPVPGGTYFFGDVVNYRGNNYSCVASSSPYPSSIPPDTDTNNWQLTPRPGWLLLGMNMDMAVWASGTVYSVGNIAWEGGSYYVCTGAHTSSPAFATDKATKWSAAVQPWKASTPYVAGNVVIYPGPNGSLYVCDRDHTSGASGKFPVDLANGMWHCLSKNFQFVVVPYVKFLGVDYTVPANNPMLVLDTIALDVTNLTAHFLDPGSIDPNKRNLAMGTPIIRADTGAFAYVTDFTTDSSGNRVAVLSNNLGSTTSANFQVYVVPALQSEGQSPAIGCFSFRAEIQP